MPSDDIRRLEDEIRRLRQLLFGVYAIMTGQWRGLVEELGRQGAIVSAELTERAVEEWAITHMGQILDEAERQIRRLEGPDREPPPAGPAPDAGPVDPAQ